MKKIYLEKQFMKATNLSNCIIGEIVAHSKESGEYQIKKEDGSIMTVFSHSILGWEEYKESSETGYRFHYHAKEVDKANSVMFYCDIYKDGKFFYKYSYGFDWLQVLNSSDPFRYFLINQGNEVKREFDKTWDDLKKKEKERPNRAFNVDKLDKLPLHPTKTSGDEKVKIVYTIDPYRQKDGSNVFGFIVSNVKENGTIEIISSNTLRGTFKSVVEIVLESVNKDVELGREAELRVNALGLGVGLLDYLDKCPVPVKMYFNDDVKASHFSLIKKVEKEELIINTKLKEVLQNLDKKTYIDGEAITPFLMLHKQDNEQCALLGALLLTCHEGGKFLCEHKFELWIEKGMRAYLTEEADAEVETYYFKIRDNVNGEEQTITSSQNRYEMENILRHMTQAFDLSGTKVKVHTKIKE